MQSLNDQQLLLLNNLMYYSRVVEVDSIKELLDEIDKKPVKERELSGGLEGNIDGFYEMIAAIKSDPSLKNLKIEASTNEDGIRAACFVDSSGNATVAFRGTGGIYEAWKDNFSGVTKSDTDMQEIAAKWLENNVLTENYNDIAVTGHSKGGNLAMYVTLLLGDRISECLAFDAQGFSDKFLLEYADLIRANEHKIRGVSAYNDFVNILMLFGKMIYVANDCEGIADGHSSYWLWKSNQDGWNEVPQQPAMVQMQLAVNELLRILPEAEKKILVHGLGVIVSALMSSDTKIENVIKDLSLVGLEYWLDQNMRFAKMQMAPIIKAVEIGRAIGDAILGKDILIDEEAFIKASDDLAALSKRIQTLQGDIDRMLNTLEKGWDTPAGKKFKKSCDTVLIQPLKDQKLVIDHVAAVLKTSKQQYQSVFDAYRDLNSSITSYAG